MTRFTSLAAKALLVAGAGVTLGLAAPATKSASAQYACPYGYYYSYYGCVPAARYAYPYGYYAPGYYGYAPYYGGLSLGFGYGGGWGWGGRGYGYGGGGWHGGGWHGGGWHGGGHGGGWHGGWHGHH